LPTETARGALATSAIGVKSLSTSYCDSATVIGVVVNVEALKSSV
jgi:hypothetical protein